jgi:hypothetical protein
LEEGDAGRQTHHLAGRTRYLLLAMPCWRKCPAASERRRDPLLEAGFCFTGIVLRGFDLWRGSLGADKGLRAKMVRNPCQGV